MTDHGQGGDVRNQRGWRAVARHFPPESRSALTALFQLDEALGHVLRTTREPTLGQLRLAWWREALANLDTAPPPAEPVLAAAAIEVLPRGVSGATLAAMIDGWEALLSEPLDEAALAAFAAGRGSGLFAATADLLGTSNAIVTAAGAGWALADLSLHVTGEAVAGAARAMALERLNAAFAMPWPAPLRPLGALALLARADLAGIAPGSPRRVARLFFHRLTGR